MNNNIATKAKSTVRTIRDLTHRYHRTSNLQAIGILKTIKKHGFALENSDKTQCDKYAVEVLGHKRFAPWLYVYAAISGTFKVGWIPDNYYGSLVVPKFKGEYGKVSSLNSLNAVIFKSDSFPDLLSYVNGVFFDAQYKFVPLSEVKNVLFRNHERVIYKLDLSLRGKGIHIMTKDSFNIEQILELGNGLFQGFIEQHDNLADFARESVATIRMTTVYLDSGDVSLRACYLRLGSGNDSHVQSASHIRVPINMETGAFDRFGYTPEWIPLKAHPTSQREFDGQFIPNFNECVSKVKELHKKAPYARCIGWDVTVDSKENVKVMDWNGEHNAINFSEATQGPCFKDMGWEQLA